MKSLWEKYRWCASGILQQQTNLVAVSRHGRLENIIGSLRIKTLLTAKYRAWTIGAVTIDQCNVTDNRYTVRVDYTKNNHKRGCFSLFRKHHHRNKTTRTTTVIIIIPNTRGVEVTSSSKNNDYVSFAISTWWYHGSNDKVIKFKSRGFTTWEMTAIHTSGGYNWSAKRGWK